MEDKHEYSKIVQQKAFTKWVNSKLKFINQPEINNIFTDLRDGTVLNNLLQCISNTAYHFNRNPKNLIYQRENLELFFNECRDLDVPLINCGAEDIISGNPKIILGLIFTLITESQYFQSGLDRDKNINHEILSWVRAVAADYDLPAAEITNFSTNWKDGKLFNCILDKYDPENCGKYFDCLELTTEDRLQKAFTNAKEFHDIEKLLDVEDLTQVDVPDSKAIFAYVSEYYNKFAHQIIESKDLKDDYTNGSVWLKKQENDYDKYVKRYNAELEYLSVINEELLRDMLKIEEKINEQLKIKKRLESTLFKASAVYSNINTVLDMSNMPRLQKEQTPDVLERKFKTPLNSYVPNLEAFKKSVEDSEFHKIERVELTTTLLKESDDLEKQSNEITKVLQNPESDAQRVGLARKIKFLKDIEKAKEEFEKKLARAAIKFDASDIRNCGAIPHLEYCALSNLIGFEPTLKSELITKAEFLKELESNLVFLDIKMANLKLKTTPKEK